MSLKKIRDGVVRVTQLIGKKFIFQDNPCLVLDATEERNITLAVENLFTCETFYFYLADESSAQFFSTFTFSESPATLHAQQPRLSENIVICSLTPSHHSHSTAHTHSNCCEDSLPVLVSVQLPCFKSFRGSVLRAFLFFRSVLVDFDCEHESLFEKIEQTYDLDNITITVATLIEHSPHGRLDEEEEGRDEEKERGITRLFCSKKLAYFAREFLEYAPQREQEGPLSLHFNNS